MPLTAMLRPPRNGPILRQRKPPLIAVSVCWAGAMSRRMNSDATTSRERRIIRRDLGIGEALYRSNANICYHWSAAVDSLGLACVFLADVKQLLNFRDHSAFAVGNGNVE